MKLGFDPTSAWHLHNKHKHNRWPVKRNWPLCDALTPNTDKNGPMSSCPSTTTIIHPYPIISLHKTLVCLLLSLVSYRVLHTRYVISLRFPTLLHRVGVYGSVITGLAFLFHVTLLQQTCRYLTATVFYLFSCLCFLLSSFQSFILVICSILL